MNVSVRQQYDSNRDFSSKCEKSLCYAPFTNLFFDQTGNVLTCCWNTSFPLGNITVEPIDEIWNGARLRRLRQAMRDYSFESGCERCQLQVDGGGLGKTNMSWFDRFPVESTEPLWPKRFELSISNSCNLQCVMCSGHFSSAIRAHRESLPVRPRIYPTNFVDSLRKYIPHLTMLKFLGGEPFLVSEYYDLWEQMIADGLSVECHLTTNCTQYNRRIEQIITKLPFSFAVSLDGASKETVEKIRVGADFNEQMRILQIFRAYTRERKTDLSLTFCFMRLNWHEFGEYCVFADCLGCNVAVNTVEHPQEFAVYNLPVLQLKEILDGMEEQAIELDAKLGRNRRIWFNELNKVRTRYIRLCGQSEQGAETDVASHKRDASENVP